MASTHKLSNYGRAYVSTVIAVGFLVIGISLQQLLLRPIGIQWFLLAGLTLISGSATVKLPGVYASISISETFVITAILLYGPSAGTLIVALDGLVISFWIARRHSEAYRPLFNMSAPAVSAWCSAHAFFWAAGIPPLVLSPAPLNQLLLPLVILAATYFLLNSWLIALVIAFERRTSPFTVWPSSFWWLSLNYFAGASVAVLLVAYTRHVDLIYVGVIVPLLLVLYFTFKTSWARVEDAQRHVDELNRLYMSTVETLAMAIDAKDQVTHGHIRRVQNYAVGLAKRVGITDQSLLKAIETAALLHDTGKLAIPEYILNKPGKLTMAEFEKMKAHASVGADILSAIDFPYPVVPIVRHHHENWNGTGYPDGLAGTAIPIGARVLSVVDCFDALTSDRPYRPKLPNDSALGILLERSGSMYDPLVVETFVQVHVELAAAFGDTVDPATEFRATKAKLVQSEPTNEEKPAVSEPEAACLLELADLLAHPSQPGTIAIKAAELLQRVIPCKHVCIFIYSESDDDLLLSESSIRAVTGLLGLRVALGHGVAGWVAANKQSMLNSDPILDLGSSTRTLEPPLLGCMGIPMLSSGSLSGVVLLCSEDAEAFNETHRRLAELVMPFIAKAAASLSETETTGTPQKAASNF